LKDNETPAKAVQVAAETEKCPQQTSGKYIDRRMLLIELETMKSPQAG
jgi:hypothetical protein